MPKETFPIAKFPVPVSHLVELVPHRDSAIWIDDIVSLSERGGQGRVQVKDAPYMTEASVRTSAFIEFMAQTYAYVSACHLIYRPEAFQKKITEAFLVGIRDFELFEDSPIVAGQCLTISVERSHELGDLVLIDGMVFSSSEKCIAKGQLKLFAR